MKKSRSMHVVMTDDSMKIIQAAAEYEELPVSLWARTALIKEARSVAHKKLCTLGKKQEFMWSGKSCTEEEMIAGEAREKKMMEEYHANAGNEPWKKPVTPAE